MFKRSKSYVIAVIAILTILSLQSFVFASENQLRDINSEPVGHDITISEGEFKIISFDGNVEDVPVGNDIELGEDEVKIVSISLDEDETVVGDDISIEEGDVKVVSMPLSEESTDNSYTKYIFIGGFLLLGASLSTLVFKKKTT